MNRTRRSASDTRGQQDESPTRPRVALAALAAFAGSLLIPPTAFAGPRAVPVGLPAPAGAAAPVEMVPPAGPVKLVFVHHSAGENWLRDVNGRLGLALRDVGYFVSDTSYGWGPVDLDSPGGAIGDHTDIGHWWSWFAGPNRSTYLTALFQESQKRSDYTRLPEDPGGENRIVVFKSSFSSSALSGNPSDPIPPIASNPLRGRDASSDAMTLANAKGIYVEILKTFATRTDKLFILVTAPPLAPGETDAATGARARALNEWLRSEWLASYPNRNVFVFDLFNVLTSDGGSTRTNDPSRNDLGWADGNHHRLAAGAPEHTRTVANDLSAYPSGEGDSHPSEAGNLKATGEFVFLLNAAYHCWLGDDGCPPSWPPPPPPACELSCQATAPASGTVGRPVDFAASVTATGCSQGPAYDWDFGDGSAHATTASASHAYAAAGTFTWRVVVSAGGQVCTRTGSVTVAAPPPPPPPPPLNLYVVPAVSHAPGASGSLWRSDVAIVNWTDVPATVDLTFVPQGGPPVSRTVSMVGRGTQELRDVLATVFESDESASVSGVLQVASDQLLCVSSRTFNQGAAGTYGGYIPAVTAAGALAYGRTGALPHLKSSSTYRTNIGVTNLGTDPVSVALRLYGADGKQAGSERALTVPAGELRQENDIFTVCGAGPHDIAFATVEVKTPGGRVWAYASVIDNGTSDPTIVPLVLP